MYKRYGLIGCFKLILSVLYTKIFYPQARLIRLPFDIRNRKYIKISKRFTSGFSCRLEAIVLQNQNQNHILISLGENVQINDYVHITAAESIIIGNNVLIASKVFISDLNHGNYSNGIADSPISLPNDRAIITKPVVISDNVWLGEGVCVLPGCTIGFGSIIGAASVVTKNIPPNCIAVGNPAKVIKQYDYAVKQWLPI